MFNIGEKIVYGKSGVCTVLDICKMKDPFGYDYLDGDFYKLQPVYDNQNVIFISTNNEKVMMRKVMSKEKAEEIIQNLENYEPVFPKDEKERRAVVRETLNSEDMTKWIQLLNGLYLEKIRRNRYKKTLRYKDEKIYNFLESFIFGELATALDISRSEVFGYLEKKIDKLKEIKKRQIREAKAKKEAETEGQAV